MLVTVRRRRPVTLAVIAFVVAALVAALVGAAGRAAAAPPINPSDQQINDAAVQKAALADEVGRLGAQIAAQQNQLRQLQAAQEMAEQKLAYALSKLQMAKQESRTAKAAVAHAQSRVEAARRDYASFAQAAYMSGSIGGTTGSLLTAPDPTALLQQSALEDYESAHQLDAVGNLSSATVAKSNADARARAAVARQRRLTDEAVRAKHEADVAVVAAIAQEQQLEQSLAENTAELQRAQEQLATLNHQRAAYLAYQRRQAEIRAARERARKLAEARARAAAQAAAAAAARARAAAAERAAAAASRHHSSGGNGGNGGGGGSHHGSSGGGSSGGGSSGGGYSAPVQASGGGWSPAKGRAAVARAMQYQGWMYAWAGGDSSGPTYGVCAGDGAYNDCHVRGFDCSGLTLYGWAPYESLPHYSVAQYDSGSFHPSTSQLRAGDLVFWSSNGSQSGVHHVAIYIGGGNVLQAPQSGSLIQITPLVDVSWGYFGATRPLT